MATVITVMNMKGGVGKTTLTAHIAGMMALMEHAGKHRRILAIDYDPQFNLSQMFLQSETYFELEKQRRTSLAILQDDETRVNPFAIQVPGNRTPPAVTDVCHTIYKKNHGGRLDLIPSTLDLMYLALGQSHARTDVFEERFQKFILAARSEYDVVLIDCHPAGSILTKTSLANSDHVLVPVVPSQFARRGVQLMRNFIDASKQGPQKTPLHIVFNRAGAQWSAEEEANIRTDPRHAAHCLVRALQKFKAYSDPRHGAGFVWYSGKPYSTTAFSRLNRLVAEITERLRL